MIHTISNKIRHFFHVLSNVRPIYWILLYVALMPVFAVVYYMLPDSQFRIPDNAGTDFGSWLYYSIVTITTLGFGDYTPAHGWAQAVTAIEVMCGLIILGLFLNAVGAMKSEIEIESELEKQRKVHASQEREKVVKSTPAILHTLNQFMAMCRLLTIPSDEREQYPSFTPDFSIDMMRKALESTSENISSLISRFDKSAERTSLVLDSLQSRVDLTLWPELLEDCFSFVANTQVFDASDELLKLSDAELSEKFKSASTGKDRYGNRVLELYDFIKETGKLAIEIESELTQIASSQVEK